MSQRKTRFGEPVKRSELPKPTKRLTQYDECLREFLNSNSELWKIHIDKLPSKNIRVVISSLKWRINHVPDFRNIKVFMRGNNVYLEKVKNDE